MQNVVSRLGEWIKKNKVEFIILTVILILGAFLRLFKIDEYMTFLGDEGRDVIIVRRFLVYGDIFLIGPGTSIGNMYLGPLYYYLMAPVLWLGNFSPVAPAAMIALLGVTTVAFVWYIAREWFGKNAAFIAALLYAIAPTVIIYSRSSWNPNIMPFFSLLCIFAIWRVVTTKKLFWLPILGISYAFVLQSHYLGLLLAPTLAVFWLYAFWLFRKDKKLRSYILYTIFAILLFAGLMSPLVIFDSRHDWRNFDAIKKFFTERQATVSARPWNAFPSLWPLTQEISARLLAGRNEILGSWAALAVLGGVTLVMKEARKLNKTTFLAFTLLILWLVTALVGLGLYKQEIYDHYYGFFFAAPFILLGGLAGHLINKAKIRGWWIVGFFLVFLVYFNFLDNPLNYPPNRQLARTMEVARKIEVESSGNKFNLAVIAERNYEDAYQYFLEAWGTGVTDIDPLKYQETITKQLFVVCELSEEKCDPTHNSKTEVANFGWSEIAEKWEISGVILYKLVHVEI